MFSSFKDYVGLRDGNWGNQQLAFELFGFNRENFYADSYKAFEEKKAELHFKQTVGPLRAFRQFLRKHF